MNYFPKHLTPRPGQIKALKEIEQAWDKNDVIVVSLPTSFGKSAIAKTIMDWQGRAAYVTPTNLLVEQFRESYNKIPTIQNKELYCCSEKGYQYCEDRAAAYSLAKQKKKYCTGCPYVQDNKRIMNPYRRQSNSTVHMYIARQLHQPVLIADEAHTLINTLQEYHAVKISHKRYKYPRSRGFISRPELALWIESIKNIDTIITEPKRGQKGLKVLANELQNESHQYLIKEEFIGGEPYLKLVPLDFRGLPNPIWPPNKVQKIVLMSATINKKDIEALGLSGRRTTYIYADSPIPAERRPIHLVKHIGALSRANLISKVPDLCNEIVKILDNHAEEKGIIHCTYQLADLLKRELSHHPRLLFHDKHNKAEVFEHFKASDVGEGLCLVASGMYEGIDLPYDAGRFQIITKIPWPSLAEPAIKVKAELDNTWYEWQALKDTLQAYGRICRDPNDFGFTYLLDSSFRRLLRNDAIPEWFKQAYKEV